MMAPMTQQLNEMKLLYENSRATSTDIGGKIDELKKLLSMQGELYLKPQLTGAGHQYLGSAPGSMDLMDPNVIKKGIEDIKDQMKEMQREAMIIESDMEKRFQAMTQKTQQ